MPLEAQARLTDNIVEAMQDVPAEIVERRIGARRDVAVSLLAKCLHAVALQSGPRGERLERDVAAVGAE